MNNCCCCCICALGPGAAALGPAPATAACAGALANWAKGTGSRKIRPKRRSWPAPPIATRTMPAPGTPWRTKAHYAKRVRARNAVQVRCVQEETESRILLRTDFLPSRLRHRLLYMPSFCSWPADPTLGGSGRGAKITQGVNLAAACCCNSRELIRLMEAIWRR